MIEVTCDLSWVCVLCRCMVFGNFPKSAKRTSFRQKGGSKAVWAIEDRLKEIHGPKARSPVLLGSVGGSEDHSMSSFHCWCVPSFLAYILQDFRLQNGNIKSGFG